ncbi:MAG: hypothetical protein ACK486_12625 [Cyanobacteriota bacterium]
MLTPEELAELEATLLPALERHHLRLLAHSLRTLQEVAGREEGPLPEPDLVRHWALQQPSLADDPQFADPVTEQLRTAGLQLQQIAEAEQRQPLGLTLADLTQWAVRQADQRIRAAAPPPPG